MFPSVICLVDTYEDWNTLTIMFYFTRVIHGRVEDYITFVHDPQSSKQVTSPYFSRVYDVTKSLKVVPSLNIFTYTLIGNLAIYSLG